MNDTECAMAFGWIVTLPLCSLLAYLNGASHRTHEHLQCHKLERAAKLATDLANDRLETIRQLQEKLEDAENSIWDLRRIGHGVQLDPSGAANGSDSEDNGPCPSDTHDDRGNHDSGRDFRANVFRFQDTFRGKCGDHSHNPTESPIQS